MTDNLKRFNERYYKILANAIIEKQAVTVYHKVFKSKVISPYALVQSDGEMKCLLYYHASIKLSNGKTEKYWDLVSLESFTDVYGSDESWFFSDEYLSHIERRSMEIYVKVIPEF